VLFAGKKKRATKEHVAKITLSDLVKYFDMPILEASKNLNVIKSFFIFLDLSLQTRFLCLLSSFNLERRRLPPTPKSKFSPPQCNLTGGWCDELLCSASPC
jgi:hypothetical protein